MSKIVKLLAALALAVLAVAPAASADVIDPIVRVRDGGDASIPIFGLPSTHTFYPPGAFPDDPDGGGTDCSVGSEFAGIVVSCLFQNLTGQTISQLDFDYLVPGDLSSLVFTAEDPDELFGSRSATSSAASFSQGGIPSGECFEEGEFSFCAGGHFYVDLVGFPEGTTARMRTSVPEPAGVVLLLTGVAVAHVRRSRRRG